MFALGMYAISGLLESGGHTETARAFVSRLWLQRSLGGLLALVALAPVFA